VVYKKCFIAQNDSCQIWSTDQGYLQ